MKQHDVQRNSCPIWGTMTANLHGFPIEQWIWDTLNVGLTISSSFPLSLAKSSEAIDSILINMIKFSTSASPTPHPPPPPPPYPPSPFPDASFLSQYCVAPLKYMSHHCIILYCCKKLLTSKKEAGYLTRFPHALNHPPHPIPTPHSSQPILLR